MAKVTAAVLGAGGLGGAMARRLAEQGIEVRLWDRTSASAQKIADEVSGLDAADSVDDAVGDVDVVLTVLPNADVISTVMSPALSRISGVWLQVSTVGPEGATRLGELAGEHGVAYLDAPVSGSVGPAADGELVWLVAGAQAVIDRVRPVLDALGKTVQHVGSGTSEGSALKLAVNAWMVASTVTMSDVLALCDRLGVGHDELRDALGAGALNMPYVIEKSKLMDSQDFSPEFSIDNALKDVSLSNPSSSILATVMARLQAAVDLGAGSEDISAVARVTSSS